MEDNDMRIVLTGFVTDTGPKSAAPRRYIQREIQEPQSKRKGPGQAKLYLLIRLGVCVLLFCGVMALKLAGPSGAEALAVLSRSIGEDTEPDTENLGRLRFVQIPSIVQVFSQQNKPALPAEGGELSILGDGALLRISVAEGERITAPCPGTVRYIGRDESRGGYVVISAGEDTEYSVYGVGDIAVEVGQPLGRGGILGSAEGGFVYVSVSRSGRPLDVAELFGLDTGSAG